MDLPLLRIKKPENTEAERQRLEEERNKRLKQRHMEHIETRKRIHNALLRGEEPIFNNSNNSNNSNNNSNNNENNGNENAWLVTNENYLFNEPPFTPQNPYKVKKMPPTPRKQPFNRLPISYKRRLSYSNNTNQKRQKTSSKGGKKKTYRRRK